MPTTGNSGTIVFGTQGFTGCYTKIGASEQSRGKLDVSCLSTTGMKESIPDDLVDPGEVQCDVIFDAENDLPEFTAAETVTITFPKSSPGATAANLAGTAFVTKVGTPEMVNGQVMKASFTIAWDGATGPTFTPESGGSESESGS